VEPSEELAGNSRDARDDSGRENADSVRPFSPFCDVRPFSPFRDVTPSVFALATAPHWMRDQAKNARAIWERRFKLSHTPQQAWPPK
jgi:hypothetical protein